MKKIDLFHPKISHAPAETNLLSLLMPHKESWGWIASNFINMSIREKNCWDEFYRYTMWAGCPFVLETEITRDIIEKITPDFTKLACDAIDEGYCVYTSINRNPVKIYNTTEQNLSHNPLIYGYDDVKEIFLVAEFFPGMIYSFKEIPFKEIDMAFQMYPQVIENHPHKKTHLVKYYNNNMYHFAATDIIAKLEEYLTSENLFDKFHQGFYRSGFILDTTYSQQFHFGLSYYDFLKYKVQEGKKLPIRPIQLLVFKNYITQFRIDYLEELGVNVKDREEIKRLAEQSIILRNRVLKSNALDNISQLEEQKEIIRLIDVVKNCDRVCCKIQINLLKSIV